MNILDWKPGTIGIPTFHCQRCMNHWLIKGDLPKDCNELEEIIEGPAMCLTLSNQASSEMIIDGIIGEDGKPVRIKVADPVSLRQQLLKQKAKKRHKRKQREARRRRRRRRRRRGYENKGDVQEDEAKEDDEYVSDDSISSSDSSGEELLNLPKAFQKYILKKAGQQHKRKRSNGGLSVTVSDGELSYSSSSLSSISGDSSDPSQVSSGECHNHKEQKSPRRQRKHRSKRGCHEKATRSSDDSACSNESDLDSTDSTCSSPYHHRKRKTKSQNRLRQHKVEGISTKCAELSEVEDQDIKTSKQRLQHTNKSDLDSTCSSPDHRRKSRKKKTKSNLSRPHKVKGSSKKHAELLEAEDQDIKTSKQRLQHTNKGDLDSTCSSPDHRRKKKTKSNLSRRHKVKGSSKKHAELLEAEDQTVKMSKQRHRLQHLPEIDTSAGKIQHRNVSDDACLPEIDVSAGKIQHRNVSGDAHLPDIDVSAERIQHRNVSNDAHLPDIDASAGRIQHRNVSDDAHLPDIDASANLVHHMSGQWENGTSNAIGSDGKSNPANKSGFQLPNIAHTRSHSTATRKHQRSDPIHLPHLNPQGSQNQLGNDSQVYHRRQSILSHGGTKEGSTNLAALNKESANSLSSNKNTTPLLKPQQQRRGSQMNYSGVSPRKPPQADRKHSSVLSAKTATVKEDVHIPAGSLPNKLKRKKKKSQLAPEELPQICSSAMDGEANSVHISATLSTTVTDRDGVNLTHNIDYNRPKRIGRKIIKKTRKSREPQSLASVNHNSKDLGNLTEEEDGAGFKPLKDSANNQDGQRVLCTIPSSDELSSSDFKLLTSSAKTPTTRMPSGTARQMQQSDFVPLNYGTGSSPSSASLDGDLYSGLGTKFVSRDTANCKLPYAPVQLNHLEEPTNKLGFMIGKTTVLPPIEESGGNLPLSLSTSQTADQKMETDSGLEIEEESLDEEISPRYDPNPISVLSFTTAYAYSFYPMAAQHKLHNTTRRKALKPVKPSRTKFRKN